MRKIILATAAILAVSSASAFAESENTTLQSLRHQQLIEANLILPHRSGPPEVWL